MRLNWAEAAIGRLLDRLEADEAGEFLMARWTAREAERDALRLELAATVAPAPIVILTMAELEAIYRQQVAWREALLTGSDQMVAGEWFLIRARRSAR